MDNFTTTIPTEIIYEIFQQLAKKPIDICSLNNSLSSPDFPWALGLVCKQWRHTFLSCAPLWAFLKLSDARHRYERAYIKEVKRRLGLYLERSKGCPLKIDVCLHRSYMTGAWRMLLSHSHRWSSASFTLHSRSHVNDLVGRRGRIPMLESLRIGRLDVARCPDTFEIAPRLTQVELVSAGESYAHDWILPWRQLTKLEITIPAPSFVLDGHVGDIFQLLDNVEELCLTLDVYHLQINHTLFQCTPARLDNLRVLKVPHPAILLLIEAPSLHELHITGQSTSYTGYIDCGEELDIRSKIRRLFLDRCTFEIAMIMVRILYDVEELYLNYVDLPTQCSAIISELANINHRVYLPSLRHLHVIHTPFRCTERLAISISKLLESRNERSPNIQSPSIQPPLSKSRLPRLRLLRIFRNLFKRSGRVAPLPQPWNMQSNGSLPSAAATALESVMIELPSYTNLPVTRELLRVGDRWPLVRISRNGLYQYPAVFPALISVP